MERRAQSMSQKGGIQYQPRHLPLYRAPAHCDDREVVAGVGRPSEGDDIVAGDAIEQISNAAGTRRLSAPAGRKYRPDHIAHHRVAQQAGCRRGFRKHGHAGQQ